MDLFPGEYTIGRAPECGVVLDDPYSSRTHGLIVVRPGGAVVQDLSSRNGVYLNGKRIVRPSPLTEGDRIGIANTILVVAKVRRNEPSRPLQAPDEDPVSEGAVARAQRIATTLAHDPEPRSASFQAFKVLGETARSALERGEPDHAERLLDRALAEVLGALRGGLPVEPDLVTFAALHALMLARALSRKSWIDFVFDLYTANRTAMPIEVVDGLDTTCEAVSIGDRNAVMMYLEVLAALTGRSAQVVHGRLMSLLARCR